MKVSISKSGIVLHASTSAAETWNKGDRCVIKVEGEFFAGTVTTAGTKRLSILFDDGIKGSVTLPDRSIRKIVSKRIMKRPIDKAKADEMVQAAKDAAKALKEKVAATKSDKSAKIEKTKAKQARTDKDAYQKLGKAIVSPGKVVPPRQAQVNSDEAVARVMKMIGGSTKSNQLKGSTYDHSNKLEKLGFLNLMSDQALELTGVQHTGYPHYYFKDSFPGVIVLSTTKAGTTEVSVDPFKPDADVKKHSRLKDVVKALKLPAGKSASLMYCRYEWHKSGGYADNIFKDFYKLLEQNGFKKFEGNNSHSPDGSYTNSGVSYRNGEFEVKSHAGYGVTKSENSYGISVAPYKGGQFTGTQKAVELPKKSEKGEKVTVNAPEGLEDLIVASGFAKTEAKRIVFGEGINKTGEKAFDAAYKLMSKLKTAGWVENKSKIKNAGWEGARDFYFEKGGKTVYMFIHSRPGHVNTQVRLT